MFPVVETWLPGPSRVEFFTGERSSLASRRTEGGAMNQVRSTTCFRRYLAGEMGEGFFELGGEVPTRVMDIPTCVGGSCVVEGQMRMRMDGCHSVSFLVVSSCGTGAWGCE